MTERLHSDSNPCKKAFQCIKGMLYHKRGILYLPLYRVYPHCTKRRVVMQKGGWRKKLRRARRALGELRKKRKVTTIKTFGLSSSGLVGNIRPVQTHTHTPDVFLYTHTYTHTHNSSNRDRCRGALMYTHTFPVSHPAIVAQHHSPWCFAAVFPGTELSLVQSRLNKNSSSFQLGDFFHCTHSETHPTPPAFKNLQYM